MKVRVFKDLDDLSRGVAERFVLSARESIKASGRFTVALSGGSTPTPFFEKLTDDLYRNFVEWEKVIVFWGDDRYVDQSNPDSNAGAAQQLLLSKVPIDLANVYPMVPGLADDAARDAANYERLLRDTFGATGPTFDFVLMGIGGDGHTASLFPGDDAALQDPNWVRVTESPIGTKTRITCTPACFNLSRDMIFMVAGADKCEVLNRALNGAPYPSAFVSKSHGDHTEWYLDHAAAANLSG